MSNITNDENKVTTDDIMDDIEYLIEIHFLVNKIKTYKGRYKDLLRINIKLIISELSEKLLEMDL